ncbi:diguanylate cyclase [Azohydromonas lata]|uniref:diguanylate cyclase n=1 Tax=Azohydromonas lata TaxID=45677 RepID=UPI000B2D30F0|nr:diguanylate cyclase [Azohydromonas lata]
MPPEAGVRVTWSRRADWSTVAAVALTVALALGGLLYHGQRLADEQVQAQRRLAVAETRHNAHLFGQTLSAVELSLRGLLQAAAQDASDEARAQRLREVLHNAPHLRSLSLLDRQGLVVLSSNPANLGVKVDLRGFLPDADGGEPLLRVGRAHVGRDLVDGVLAGGDAAVDLGFVPVLMGGGAAGPGVVATLNVDFFLNRLMARESDTAWAVDLLRWDGALLLSTRDADPAAWRRANQALVRRWQDGADIGTLLQPMGEQGTWITAYRSDHARPFAVVARVDEAAALAGARAEVRRQAWIVTPLIGLAALALLGGYGMFRRATLRRMRVQAEQVEQQARLLDALPAAVLLFAPNGRALQINQAWRDMARDAALPAALLGGPHYEALGALYQGDDPDAPTLGQGIAAVLAGQADDYQGSFHGSASAGPRWYRVLVRPLQRDGRRCALLLQMDVTAQRRSAEALRLNSRVFAINAEAIVITDAHNRIVSVNPAFSRITGYGADEVLGRTPSLLASGQHDTPFYRAMWTQLLEQGSWAGEIINRRKSGECYTQWLTIHVDRDAEGRPLHFVGLFQDITERKRAESQLRLLGAALDAADNAVMITDSRAVIEWANPAFSRLSGYSLQELVGRRPQDLLSSGDQRPEIYALMWRTILAGEVWRGEMSNCRPDGTPYHVSQTITPLADEHGSVRHFIAVLEDISERKARELELRRLATTDALTGVLNRRAFLEALEEELVRYQRHRRVGAVLMLDLDHFKLINDRHGHAAGDVVLAQVCAVARERLRRTDRMGRLGGEEFAVLLPDTTREGAAVLAETLRHAVAGQDVSTAAGPLNVTVSIGVAAFGPTERETTPLLGRADRALYQAKDEGRNRVVVAQDAAATA